MNLAPQTSQLLTLAEMAREVSAPESLVGRLGLAPDFLAAGRLRLFRPGRISELRAAIAARQAQKAARADEHDPHIYGKYGNSAKPGGAK